MVGTGIETIYMQVKYQFERDDFDLIKHFPCINIGPTLNIPC